MAITRLQMVAAFFLLLLPQATYETVKEATKPLRLYGLLYINVFKRFKVSSFQGLFERGSNGAILATAFSVKVKIN
jgi:hypothetical protein